ncbi:hypothetical protein GCM10009557_44580 [Virgisporangium ochraceum]
MPFHSLRRSRVVRIALAVSVQLTGLVTVGAGAFLASVDLPDAPQAPEASQLLYSDGRTVLAYVGVTNRGEVALADVPLQVRHAVLAAEDRGFYDHRGVSARGMVRAVTANVFGDGLQGASTITQQYVKNAYLTGERSIHRKVREAELAMRLEERHSKDQILERYLNTIYFGRGAYGIAAAAQTYFGVPVGEVTLAQGAVLAAAIKDPWGFDPAENPGPARARWHWILSKMTEEGWVTGNAVRATPYPVVAPPRGPAGHVVDLVERELGRYGVTPQTLRTAGLRVVTTIDREAQRAAADHLAPALDADLRAALVAVDPHTGAVRAYHGGGSFDYARGLRPPAATFHPVVLAEALRQGISARSRWNGSSPRTFRGRPPLYNPGNAQCPDCTLLDATARSLSTPLYDVAERVGPAKVADLAHRLGVTSALVDLPGEPTPGETRADIALGRYPVSPADLASVYATFAAKGIRRDRHVVTSASSRAGGAVPVTRTAEHRVLGERVAADVTEVLAAAPRPRLPDDRPAVALSGTVRWGDGAPVRDGWTAGYTPDLAVVVWTGRETPDGPDPAQPSRDAWTGFVGVS